MKIDNNSSFIFLTAHIKKVMYTLLEAEHPLNVHDISKRIHCSVRQIYYDFEHINYTLKKASIDPICQNNEYYYFTPQQSKQVFTLLSKAVRITEKDNRIAFTICTLLASSNKITIYFLQEILGSSRNTIINDIASIKKIFSQYNLSLIHTKKDGYFVSGDTYSRNYVLCFYLSKFCKSSHYAFLNIFTPQQLQETISNVEKVLETLSLSVKSREVIVASHFIQYLCVNQPDNFYDSSIIETSKIYNCVKTYFPTKSCLMQHYIALILLSFCPEMLFFSEKNLETGINQANIFLQQFEKQHSIVLENRTDLCKNLGSYFCFIALCHQNRVPAINIFAEEIKKEYHNLFDKVNQTFHSINSFPFPTYNNEYAAIVLQIIPHITFTKDSFHLRTILVCHSNQTLVRFLISQIQSISEFILVTNVFYSQKQLTSSALADCDLILSTSNLSINQPFIRIASIITLSDKEKILSHLVEKLSCSQTIREP